MIPILFSMSSDETNCSAPGGKRNRQMQYHAELQIKKMKDTATVLVTPIHKVPCDRNFTSTLNLKTGTQ